MTDKPLYIDNLQYVNWKPHHFQEMADGQLSAVHITICYHENFRETVSNFETFNTFCYLLLQTITT